MGARPVGCPPKGGSAGPSLWSVFFFFSAHQGRRLCKPLQYLLQVRVADILPPSHMFGTVDPGGSTGSSSSWLILEAWGTSNVFISHMNLGSDANLTASAVPDVEFIDMAC